MKIVVYGTGKFANRFCDKMENCEEKIEIQYFVETHKTKDEFKGKAVKEATEINKDDFDYLVIAVGAYDEIEQYLKENLKEYSLFADKVVSSLLFFEYIDKNSVYNTMPYQSVTVDKGISYITESSDVLIGGDMRNTKKNLAESLIKSFFELTDLYYGKKERKGIFLDIGANVGTTSIYVKKVMNPQLHIIGFEVGKKNYDLFRVNCIINNVEDIEVEHVGLGNCNESKSYCYSRENSGGSFIVDNPKDEASYEDVNLITLDEYFSHRDILEEIDYIWLDTEGYEANIIEGAVPILKKKRIPLVHEFNPFLYIEGGSWDLYKKNMKNLYKNFIDAREYGSGTYKEWSVDELEVFVDKMEKDGVKQTDLFFY